MDGGSCLVPRMCAAHRCLDGFRRTRVASTPPTGSIGQRRNHRQARMSPAGRTTSVAPDSVETLSSSVVTDKAWWFSGMTTITAIPANGCFISDNEECVGCGEPRISLDEPHHSSSFPRRCGSPALAGSPRPTQAHAVVCPILAL
jgi:hypothetical protein